MKKEALAAMMAAMADVDLMTCDRLEALTKGHGMLNLAVYSIANVIASIRLITGSWSMSVKGILSFVATDWKSKQQFISNESVRRISRFLCVPSSATQSASQSAFGSCFASAYSFPICGRVSILF